MRLRNLFTAGGVACLAIVVLVGCRSEEQNRITKYEPGVYKGVPDQALSSAQRRVLRNRALMQSGSVKPAGGGGGAKPGRDVRKPVVQKIDLDKLNSRTRLQKGAGP